MHKTTGPNLNSTKNGQDYICFVSFEQINNKDYLIFVSTFLN